MGDRCVITTCDVTKENQDKKLGLYLHWCVGGKKGVEQILSKCKEKQIRTPSSDYSYFWARFCQIASDFCGDGVTGIGIDLVSRLDVQNYDNGVYYIDDDFNIIKQTDESELIV